MPNFFLHSINRSRFKVVVYLAEIYGYETKSFNRQVKNNKEKFEGDDFMFQLTRQEVDGLSKCKNCTLNRGEGKGNYVLI